MRRQLLTLALTGVFGALVLSTDASACCKKKRCAAPVATCAPCVAVVPPPPPPCPPPAPVVCEAPVKKGCCGKKFHLFGGLCHKRKAACVAPVVYAAPVAPVYYPAAPSVQSIVPSGQAWH